MIPLPAFSFYGDTTSFTSLASTRMSVCPGTPIHALSEHGSLGMPTLSVAYTRDKNLRIEFSTYSGRADHTCTFIAFLANTSQLKCLSIPGIQGSVRESYLLAVSAPARSRSSTDQFSKIIASAPLKQAGLQSDPTMAASSTSAQSTQEKKSRRSWLVGQTIPARKKDYGISRRAKPAST